GTGRLTKSAVSNAQLFCQDQFQKEFVTVLADMREEVLSTQMLDVGCCLLFLQKLIFWMAEPHLDLRMNPSAASKKGAPCVAKDVDSIRGYVAQIRLVMKKVGGIPISSEDIKDYHFSYPPMVDKEEPEPMTLEEFRLICDSQINFRRQMLYRCKKDFEARIGAMCQLRKRNFNTKVRPIAVTFPKAIMKKKNGISFTNVKYVIEEDEEGVLQLLENLSPDDLVFGTTENVELAINNEEKTWSRLVQNIGFTARYKHNNRLKKNIHSIKSMTFTAARKAVDTDYANAYGDHAAYCKTYLRLSDEEKIDYFKRLEPYITMYTKTVKIHDSDELFQENIELKKQITKNDEQNAINDEKFTKLAEEIKSKTNQIPDEKMQEMFEKFLKNKSN
ncbi:MAG: hypothetical protein O6761_00415, partial [Thaumarchaeota archaeon]|nr:hypothetical protein [Nitrososphaerota archaeon]